MLTHRHLARDTRLLDDARVDFAQAVRTLRKAPRFTILAVLILAIGIGGTTAVFSAVDAVLLKPLPYQQPGQLVRLYQYFAGYPQDRTYVTGAHYLAYRKDLSSVSGLAALDTYDDHGADIGTGENAARIRVLPVTADYFDVMRATPILGRGFDRTEVPGGPVVVLSHNLWERRFAGRADAVGSSLTMSGVPRTVIGVMPAGFEDPLVRGVDAWVPEEALQPTADAMDPGNHYLTVIGRLRTGVSVQRAQAELDVLGSALVHLFPKADRTRAVLVPLRDDVVGPASRTLELMLGAVGLVLLLVCVNIANLLLVRGSDRAREFALRAALGARGGRLLRQLLTESVVLALAGGLAGVALARALVPAIVGLGRGSIPRLATLSIDWPVLAFTFAIAGASALAFGLLPALRASRTAPGDVIRENAQHATGGIALGRLRSALVVSQVALAFILLIGAGLLVASVAQLQRTDLGVTTDDVLTFQLNLPAARYDSVARARFYEQFAQRVEGLPGVRAVGGTSRLPATGSYNSWTTQPLSGPLTGVKLVTPSIEQRVVSGHYFRAVGMQVLQGRVFDERDDALAPPRVVVSASLAANLFPGIDPLGQRLRTASTDYQIIGVVNDVALDAEGHQEPCIYHAHRQFAGDRNWALTQVVATNGPPADAEPAVRRALASLDPQLVMFQPMTLGDAIGRGRAQRVFTLRILVSFAAVALILAALGLFGVLSYAVRLRAREIGIRMALGADGRSIRGMVLRDAGIVTVIGVGIGVVGAASLSRLMASVIFHVSPLDPTVMVSAIAMMALVAAVAAYLPAYRASHLAPRAVLQGE